MLTASYPAAPAATPPTGSATTRAWCIFLALVSAGITAWWTVIGIEATEPASPARFAKVVTGVFLIVVELTAFGLAASGTMNRGMLRALGAAVLVLDIAIMSIAQIAIGMSAHKSEQAGVGTVAQLEQSIAAKREQAAALRRSADGNAQSKFASSRRAGEASLAEAKALEREADAQAGELAKLRGEAVASQTSVIEIVGQWGLIALSIALSVLLSLTGIALMHHAGGMWRRAGATGAAAAPAAVPGELPASARVVPLKRPDGRFGLAAAGAAGLAAFAASPTPAQAVTVPHQAASPTLKRFEIEAPAGATTSKHSGAEKQEAKQKKPRKAVSLAAGKKIDTGVGDTDGSRYQRVREAVQAGTLKPSIRAIQKAHGGSPRTVQGYLSQLASEGITERTASGTYRLAGERLAA